MPFFKITYEAVTCGYARIAPDLRSLPGCPWARSGPFRRGRVAALENSEQCSNVIRGVILPG